VPKNQPALRAFSQILAAELIALSRFGFKQCWAITKGNALGYNNMDSDCNPSPRLGTRPHVAELDLTPKRSWPGRSFQLQLREQERESFPTPAASLADAVRGTTGLKR